MSKEFFRANVGAIIVDTTGYVLACKRADLEHDAWQLPQGGMDQGETPREAVYREIEEETGIAPAQLVLLDEATEWMAYELPAAYRSARTGRGQVQKWFVFRFVGSDEDIHPDQREFSDWRWSTLMGLSEHVVEFRRPIYRKLLAEFQLYLYPFSARG